MVKILNFNKRATQDPSSMLPTPHLSEIFFILTFLKQKIPSYFVIRAFLFFFSPLALFFIASIAYRGIVDLLDFSLDGAVLGFLLPHLVLRRRDVVAGRQAAGNSVSLLIREHKLFITVLRFGRFKKIIKCKLKSSLLIHLF